MRPDDALRAAPRLLRRRAGALLPLYLLAASLPGVARTPFIFALAVAVGHLATVGRLDPVVATLRELGVGAPGTETVSGETTSPTPEETAALADALAGLLTPTVAALLVVGAAGTLVALVLCRGVVAAATLGGVAAGLDGEPPLVAGVRDVPAHWRAFATLTLVRGALYVALGGLVFGVAGVGAALGGRAAVALGVVAALAALPVVVVAELLFAFAGPAVVVDDVGAAGALRRAAGLARRRPVVYAVFLVVATVVLVGVVLVSVVAGVAGVERVVGLVVVLVVFPAFDGLRVALYADGDATVPSSETAGPTAVVRDGLAALGAFVRDHPGATFAGGALLGVGAAAGWALVAPYGLSVGGPADVGNVFGPVPVGPFVDIAVNNWLVGAGAAYGGLAAGLPTVAALGVNGVLLGVVAAVVERTAFLALVGPHAILELPAIAVAGGLGLHLGRVGVGAVRGRRDATSVAAALDRAARVLVGLAVVFVVAAAIEAFLTPAVAAAVL